MANSADPDQLASSEANWSDLHCLQKQGISGFSRTWVNNKYLDIQAWANNVVPDQMAPKGTLCLCLLCLPLSQYF